VKRDELTGEWPTAAHSLPAVPGVRFMDLHGTEAARQEQVSRLRDDVRVLKQKFKEAREQNEALNRLLDDANGRLAADLLIELSDNQLREAYAMPLGRTMSIESQRVIIKRVE